VIILAVIILAVILRHDLIDPLDGARHAGSPAAGTTAAGATAAGAHPPGRGARNTVPAARLGSQLRLYRTVWLTQATDQARQFVETNDLSQFVEGR
ncbi:MAG: hypothetical protein OSB09_11655, partial [Planctomycetota bacterium]|nr:hypothetical protein [Planctomycetota bacterium]